MKAPGMWAGIGALSLAFVAPWMLVWGFLNYLSPPAGLEETPGSLFAGGSLAILGAGATALLLLIGRLRPESSRRRWRLAAFVVMAAAVVLGPIYGFGFFLWVAHVGME